MTDDVKAGSDGEHPLGNFLHGSSLVAGASTDWEQHCTVRGTQVAPSAVDWHCVVAALMSRTTPTVMAAALIATKHRQLKEQGCLPN